MVTRQEVRRLLVRWAKIGGEITALEGQIKAIADEIDAVGDLHAQNLDGMPHSGQVGRPTEAAAMKRIDLAERYHDRISEINRKIEDAERFRDRIETALIWTSPDEEYVIRMHYVGHLEGGTGDTPQTFEQIADAMGCTPEHVQQLETVAVVTIKDFINKEGTWKNSKF